jgi:hypothetical protein
MVCSLLGVIAPTILLAEEIPTMGDRWDIQSHAAQPQRLYRNKKRPGISPRR